MTERARHLLRVLASKGICAANETGVPAAELEQLVQELHVFDDTHQRVMLVNTWHVGDRLMALELTQYGRTVAQAATARA